MLGDPVIVTPAIAMALLGRPLRFILENGRNDRAFLLAFCDNATRALLENAEAMGWLVFDTAGGIGELKARVASALSTMHDTSSCAEALRTLYLCDSDAREPDAISKDARDILASFEKLHAKFARHLRSDRDRPRWLGRVLKRRAAENYAPPSDVLRWAADKHGGSSANALIEQAGFQRGRSALQVATGERRSTRRLLLAAIAFREVDNEVRSLLCMKQGRGSNPPRTADVIWSRLDPYQAAALQDGFGQNFSTEFFGNARQLGDDTDELSQLIENLLERL